MGTRKGKEDGGLKGIEADVFPLLQSKCEFVLISDTGGRKQGKVKAGSGSWTFCLKATPPKALKPP